jgi:hypothetical protein
MTAADSNSARRLMLWGATIVPAGIAAAAIFAPHLGSVLTLLALAILIAGLHLFGRAGPDSGE